MLHVQGHIALDEMVPPSLPRPAICLSFRSCRLSSLNHWQLSRRMSSKDINCWIWKSRSNIIPGNVHFRFIIQFCGLSPNSTFWIPNTVLHCSMAYSIPLFRGGHVARGVTQFRQIPWSTITGCCQSCFSTLWIVIIINYAIVIALKILSINCLGITDSNCDFGNAAL